MILLHISKAISITYNNVRRSHAWMLYLMLLIFCEIATISGNSERTHCRRYISALKETAIWVWNHYHRVCICSTVKSDCTYSTVQYLQTGSTNDLFMRSTAKAIILVSFHMNKSFVDPSWTLWGCCLRPIQGNVTGILVTPMSNGSNAKGIISVSFQMLNTCIFWNLL